VLSIWIIVDFPDDAKFLNPLEKYVVTLRLKNDGQRSYRSETLKWKYISAAFKDWKLYLAMLMGMGVAGSLYAFSLFLPSIVLSMNIGKSLVETQLLCVPQYAFAAIFVCASCDRFDGRA
jgi:hypothetical protein